MRPEDPYIGREQTKVKHFILQKYLERFAHIIGSVWNTITYVDCFSGPWNVRSDDLKDSSFAIALNELRQAQSTYTKRGKPLSIRCMFLEKNANAYEKLKAFADQIEGAEVETRNRQLEEAIPDVLEFVRKGGKGSFPFIFIDPTGWTGFGMNVIAPLLRLKPGEVLINFMTDYIRRFIDSPQEITKESFGDLFGSPNFKIQIENLPAEERTDALLRAYCQNIRKIGDYRYTCAAIVLYPEKDRPYFHLIYATRDRKGVEVFKDVEKKAMEVMEETRAAAKQRRRIKRTQRRELFPADVLTPTRPIDNLRERYYAQAKQHVADVLQTRKCVLYDEAWDLALSFPLVWESDLKEWISEWCQQRLQLTGMGARQRVPKLGQGIELRWQSSAS